MRKKTMALVSSCTAIAVCSSLIVGSTYALFTSESKVDITVKSGKVDVVATLDKSYNEHLGYEVNSTLGNALVQPEFVANDNLKLNNIVPGDSVTVKIDVVNNSTVTVKYRAYAVIEDLDGGSLSEVLTTDFEVEGEGISYDGAWHELAAATNPNGDNLGSVYVTVALPEEVTTNMEESCTVSFAVEAVQGNATTQDDVEIPEGYTPVANEEQLRAVLKEGGNVYLTQDLTVETLDITSEEGQEEFNNKLYEYYGNNGELPSLIEELSWRNGIIFNKDATLDLGGNTLTTNNIIINNCNVKIINGTIKDIVNSGQDVIMGAPYSQNDTLSLELDGVTITTNDTALDFDSGRDMNTNQQLVGDVDISIKNSTINGYIVARDNSGRGNWNMSIENSTVNESVWYLHTDGSIVDSTINSSARYISHALAVSSKSNVTVSNSTITLPEQFDSSNGIVVTSMDNNRGDIGNLTLTNCTLSHNPEIRNDLVSGSVEQQEDGTYYVSEVVIGKN